MDSNKDEDAAAAAFISDPMEEEEDNNSSLSLHLPLPSAFLDFLRENELDPSIYHAASTGNIKIPRYIRLKPGCESQLAEIEAELKCRLNKVDWLPGFFAIQSHIQIASTNAYRSGKIYGMDAASGAAVMALNISPGDHILDLCAAPAATCSEDMENIFMEWNSKRLWRARKHARKAKHSTELHAVPETTEPELIFYGKDSGVVGLHRSELCCAVDEVKYLISGYDKVLVDAECTHDGSFKHIQKFEYWGWKTLQRRVLDAKRTDNLIHLQLKLLSNGFRLLKVGGSLVYSTCSLTISQNEDVVEQFLSKNSSAVLQEIDAADNWHCKSGRIPNTLRFDPKASQTSGLFIAKLKKVAM